MQTFFEGSTAQAVAALLGEPWRTGSADEDLDRLSQLIDQARNEGTDVMRGRSVPGAMGGWPGEGRDQAAGGRGDGRSVKNPEHR